MKASHILAEAGRGIRRNRGTFLLSAAVQGICLMLLSLFVVLTVNVFALVRAAEREIELDVFITEPAVSDKLVPRIAAIEGVLRARYVSKDAALDELRQELGEDASLVEALGENPLPASVRVTLSPEYAAAGRLDEVERKVALLPGVSEVWSGKETIGRLNRITRAVLIVDILMLVIVSCAVAFIVFQTVEASVAARRHEIDVMELVGASRMTVRLPFLLEGLGQGLAGGVAAVLLVFLLYRAVAAAVAVPIFPFRAVVGVNAGLGGLLGLAGALIAVGRVQQPHHARLQVASSESRASTPQ
jgi:cell division transport system permease protein